MRVITSPSHSLKADLALATGSLKKLSPGARDITRPRQAADGTLERELSGFSSDTCHHAVLVVTNCAITNGALPHEPPGGYRSTVDFTVEAELVG